MNVHERFIKTLEHEEPDRVPTMVQTFERPFVKKFNAQLSFIDRIKKNFLPQYHLEVANKLGLDAIWYHYGALKAPPTEKPEIPKEIKEKYKLGRVNNYAHYSKKGSTGMRWYSDGALKTPELIKDWISFINTWTPMPDIYYNRFKKIWDKFLKKGTIPIPTAGAVSWVTWSSIGMNRFAYMVRKHINLVKDLAKAYGRITMDLHNCFFERGVDMVFVCDDWALKDREIFSPKQWEEIIFPVYKEIAENAHKQGAKFLVHTDGNIVGCLPALIKAKADAIDPLEYEANVRIEELADKFGQDITLIGNISATYTLTYGTVEETIEQSKKLIDIAAPGGGFVLAPGSDVLGTCKVENLKAMIHTAKTYGIYKH